MLLVLILFLQYGVCDITFDWRASVIVILSCNKNYIRGIVLIDLVLATADPKFKFTIFDRTEVFLC